MDKRIKFRENKQDKSGTVPDFTVIYSKMPEKERNIASYGILSSFKKEAQVVVEIHTELLSVNYEDRTRVFDGVMEEIKKKKISYRLKKLPPGGFNINNNIFRQLFQKQDEIMQVFFYIDEQNWNDMDFIHKLPPFGVKYYFFDPNSDPVKVLDDLNAGILSGADHKYFKAVIFDCIVIGQMGLFAGDLSLEEIKSIIG